MTDIQNPKPAGISRRTVTKGIAWSVPAMAIATAAPAYAVSPPISFAANGGSCKVSAGQGSNTYYFVFQSNLPQNTPVTITSWTWYPNDAGHAFESFTPVTAPVDSKGDLVFKFTDDASSATNGKLDICFTWMGQATPFCLSTGNNNYSSCGNKIPSLTGGEGYTFPAPSQKYPYVAPALVEESTAEASAVERTAEEAPTEEPAAEDPVTKEAPAEEPVTEAEVPEEPVAEAEVPEEPVAEAPVEPTSDETVQESTDS